MIRNYFAVDRLVFAAFFLSCLGGIARAANVETDIIATELALEIEEELMKRAEQETFCEKAKLNYHEDESFNPHGQQLCVFKALKKAKYPMLQTYDHRTNNLSSILCGTLNTREKKPQLVKKPEDLQQLTVLREIIRFEDSSAKADKKYPGFRESLVGSKLEDVLTIAGLLEGTPYPGNILYDEICQGMHLWWVTDSNGFKNTRIYLQNLIAGKGPLKATPYLVLDLLDGAAEDVLSNEDITFINQNFKLIKPNAENAVYKFFTNTLKTIGKISTDQRNLKLVMESWTEMLLRLLERDHQDFKAKEYSTSLVKVAAAAFIGANIADPIKKICTKRLVPWGGSASQRPTEVVIVGNRLAPANP